MFFFLNSGGEALCCIFFPDLYLFLRDDRPAIEFFGDEMNGNAMNLVSCIQCSLVGVQARVFRQ